MNFTLKIERDTSSPCHFASVAELEAWNRSQQRKSITEPEEWASGSWTNPTGAPSAQPVTTGRTPMEKKLNPSA